ncbi:hypothetical protein [Synechococcus sp. BA-132 BA5]|nr:hypothetical protein [Synechococcus sp. BA-132 BA5]MEA5417202.1 hypothetical protein [Synechococcus sp. BA-132 BA5]
MAQRLGILSLQQGAAATAGIRRCSTTSSTRSISSSSGPDPGCPY